VSSDASGPGVPRGAGIPSHPGPALRSDGWPPVPAAEIESRITRFQSVLAEAGIDVAIIIQNSDLFYLTGTIQQGQLLVPATGEPVYLVRKDLDRARRESPVADIRPIDSLRELPAALTALGIAAEAVVGMELDVVPVTLFRRYESLFRRGEIRDCSSTLRQLRSVKSAYELGLIAEAAQIVDLGVRAGAEALREGMTELELSTQVERAMRLAGQGIVRFRAFNEELPFGNVSAGASAAMPGFSGMPLTAAGPSAATGQSAGWHRIRRGEPVVVDMVGCAGGYLADQTRTLCVGPLPADMAEGYRLCVEVQGLVAEAAKAGVACGDVYKLALDHMTAAVRAAGLQATFMGAPKNEVPYIGHGLGVELDELPVIARGFKSLLEEDQVIACEPKLIFPERGVVGVENTWRVTATGLERITISEESVVEA
jgi:Xaa-Pro dipeptidase